MKDFTTMSPVEIDTELANFHGALMRAQNTLRWNDARIMDMAGLRVLVHGDYRTGAKSYYRVNGTFAEARAAVERWTAAYLSEQGRKYEDLSEDAHKGISTWEYGTRYLNEYDQAKKDEEAIIVEIVRRDAEFARRGGWTRKFLVTSSSGHLHQDMDCTTCRPTTTYGWWPELSGLTEAEAIEALGDRADALCSLCFPTAPVLSKRKHITKAQARKLATAFTEAA